MCIDHSDYGTCIELMAARDDQRPLGGVWRLLCRVLSLAHILHHGDVAGPAVHGVGDGLEPAVRESHVVLPVGQISVSALLGAEVVAGVVVLHGVLPGVDGGGVSVLVHVGGGGLVSRGLGLVDNLGGRPGGGGLVGGMHSVLTGDRNSKFLILHGNE